MLHLDDAAAAALGVVLDGDGAGHAVVGRDLDDLKWTRRSDQSRSRNGPNWNSYRHRLRFDPRRLAARGRAETKAGAASQLHRTRVELPHKTKLKFWHILPLKHCPNSVQFHENLNHFNNSKEGQWLIEFHDGTTLEKWEIFPIVTVS